MVEICGNYPDICVVVRNGGEKLHKNLKKLMVRDGMCGESADGLKIVLGISYSFCVIFVPSLAPISNFIQIGRKT